MRSSRGPESRPRYCRRSPSVHTQCSRERQARRQGIWRSVIGNLVSNTIIVFVALTVSLKLAIGALVFLVLIHKLEYFLNSKIIGSRIRNPVWLTLIALIIGERLMGIPGLILAPVVLNYLRVEMLKVEVPTRAS